MKKTNVKSKISTITVILILTISALTAVLPQTFAQDPAYSKLTHPYIGATPNPVGVGQEVLLHVGITDYLYVVSDGWEGLTVTVTKPDATTETLGPFRSDATGGTGTIYIPTMIGTYKFQTHFPEQTYLWAIPPLFDPEFTGLILYKASDSEVLEVVVNEEQKEFYTASPLPSNYWTRPIDGQHREWNTISGSWLEGSGRNNAIMPFNDYAPDSAHILWTKPLELGGLAGGTTGEHAFDCGDAYEGKYLGSVIIGGILFYNKHHARPTTQEVIAVDLHTGETLWQRSLTTPDGNVVRLSMAQQLYHDSFNYHAVFDFLWAMEVAGSFFDPINLWHAFDPFTGDWMYSMENVPSTGIRFGAQYTLRGPKGEFLIHSIDLNNGWVALWNSTRVVFGDSTGFDQGSFRPYGNTYDAMRGYQSNVSFPTGLPGTLRFITETKAYGNDVSGWQNIGDNPINQWCVSLETGDLLWKTTWTPPLGELTITAGARSDEEGIFVLVSKETRQVWGFDLETGQELWGPTESMPYLGIYGINTQIVYGKVIVAARMAGTVNAYDAQTGAFVWSYEAVDPFGEMLWGNIWPIQAHFYTDGKLYLGHTEHSPVDPKPRGAPFICLDMETGEEIWRANGLFRQTDWGGQAIIGDSIIATMDSYDQRIYAIGRGPSATTVNTPNVGAHVGSAITISGSVMDISPGTTSPTLMTRFPNGVPAVSDASMSDWMLYVYKQFSEPMASGVQVKLEAYDPNGNYQNLGTVTTDSYGNYGFSYEPEVPGTYYIFATFEGTNAYFGSSSSAYFSSNPAPTPATLIEPEEPEEPETPTEPEATEPEATEPETTQPDPNEPEPTEPTTASAITTEQTVLAAVAISFVIGAVSFWGLRKQRK